MKELSLYLWAWPWACVANRLADAFLTRKAQPHFASESLPPGFRFGIEHVVLPLCDELAERIE